MVLLDVQDVVAAAPRRSADRRAAASLLQPPTSPLRGKGVRLVVKSVVFLPWPTACPIWLQRRSFRPHHDSARCSRPQGSLLGTTTDCGCERRRALPPPALACFFIARDRDAPKRGYLDSNRSACRRYFTGMI